MKARPSYRLSAGTHVVTTSPGFLTLCNVIGDGANDVTVDCHNCDAAADIAANNEIITFKIKSSLNGYQGGGNINHPLYFSNGLVVKVTGTNGKAHIGISK